MEWPNNALHLKPVEAPTLSYPVKAPTVKLDGGGSGKAGMDDLAARMAAVAESAKKKCVNDAEKGLTTDPLVGLGPAVLFSNKVESLISSTESLLRKVNKLLREKKYQEALAVVDQALREEPGNPEALYLLGFANYKLGAPQKALLAVRPLRGKPLPGKLATQVGDLREAARKRMMRPLIDSVLPRLQKDGPERDAALAELDKAAQLDPDADAYHFLLAAGLLQADRVDQALGVIERGIRECPTAADAGLHELRQRIRERQVMNHMHPAREFYRRGEYAKARIVLGRIGQENRGAPLFVSFDGFLAQLSGGTLFGLLGKKTPANVDPPGTPAEADGLYFFLVREELFLAKLMMAVGQFPIAAEVLSQAYSFAPRFQYLNFLLGFCIYNATMERMNSPHPLEPGEFEAALERSLALARCGAKDPELETSRQLVVAIEEIQGTIHQSREEARPVNAVIQEFHAAMGLVGDGIRSESHLDKVHSALQVVGRKIPVVRARVRNSAATDALDQLAAVIRDRLAELEGVRARISEEERLKAHLDKFNAKMTELNKKQISSRAELAVAQNFFRSLKSDVESDLHRVNSEQAEETLGQLRDAIGGILEQLDL